MLELTMSELRRDKHTIQPRWFVDKVEKGLAGRCLVNLFNSDSETECLNFMRRYRNER